MKKILIKLVGVFEHQGIKPQGYNEQTISSPAEAKFFKDNYFEEFRQLVFPQDDSRSDRFRYYERVLGNEYNICAFLKGEHGSYNVLKESDISLLKAELTHCPNGIGFFAITIDAKATTINELTRELSLIRGYDQLIRVKEGEDESTQTISAFLENDVLGFSFRSDEISDKYSGPKFKLYVVYDDPEIQSEERWNTVYDIATCSPEGSAAGKGFMAPHQAYLDQLEDQRVRYFRNYEGLALLDGLTIVGKELLDMEWKAETWDKTYFRIYQYNLFIKYSLYRYNANWRGNVEKHRKEFELFYHTYVLKNIAYAFLPEDLNKRIAKGFELDAELELFKNRVSRMSQLLAEQRSERLNKLIGLFSGVAVFGVIDPDLVNTLYEASGLSLGGFVLLIVAILIPIGLGLLIYLYPKKVRKLLGRKVEDEYFK